MKVGDLVRYKPKFISELPEENAGNVGIIVDNLNLGLFNETPSYVVQWNGVNEPTIFSGLMLEVLCK
jgi:hypothetical protein